MKVETVTAMVTLNVQKPAEDIAAERKRAKQLKISLGKIKAYIRGWVNFYGIASRKNLIAELNQWLCHRIRMCIWKHWKKPETKAQNLQKLGVPVDLPAGREAVDGAIGGRPTW